MARRKKSAEVVTLHAEEVERVDDGPAVPLAFDYEKLVPEHRAVVMHAACTVKLCAAVTIASVITMGEHLAQVKELLPHGQWLEWLATEFAWSDQTARRYIGVAGLFEGKSNRLLNLDGLTLEAAYTLAQKSTPDDVRREALKLVTNGQRVTRKMVIEMLGVPPQPSLPKEEKKRKKPEGSVDPELALVAIIDAGVPMKQIAPGEIAAVVTPVLRRRYHDELLLMTKWCQDVARELEELGYAKTA